MGRTIAPGVKTGPSEVKIVHLRVGIDNLWVATVTGLLVRIDRSWVRVRTDHLQVRVRIARWLVRTEP
mgnify:CR=1 FL=1